MRQFVLLTIALLPACLAGCAPVTTYYREGAAVADVDRALTACTARADRDVPVLLQTRYTPTRVKRDLFCDAEGNCDVDIDVTGGEPFEVDINADRRNSVVAQCMAASRYAPVTLPACPPEVARAAPAGVTATLPRLTPKTCAISRDGGFRIVTRG